MKKYRRLMRSMLLSILFSACIIWYFNTCCQKSLNSSIISNIFIGILGSSLVTLVGYFFEYFDVKNEYKSSVFDCYREIRIKIIPYLNKDNDELIKQIMRENIIYNVRELISGNLFIIKICDRISRKKLFKKNWNNIYYILPKYIQALNILSEIHDYITSMNCNIYIIEYLQNKYNLMYKKLKDEGLSECDIISTLEITKRNLDLYKSRKETIKNQYFSTEKVQTFKESYQHLDIAIGLFIN